MKRKTRVLAVDDEPRYIWAIRAVLEGVGYETLAANDGETALELAAVEAPDLILLDIRLPDMDGYTVCQRIREFSKVPIVMLTALADEAEKVRGLDAGADDYVTKPFGAPELLARVRAVLRRVEFSEAPSSSTVVRAGDLAIDLAQQCVTMQGQEISLSATEYRLLCEFAKQPQRLLVPEYLLERVWGPGYEEENHMLRQAIYRLRRKIEPDPTSPQYIQTKPGMGYLFGVATQN
ncbi:MAG: response regulator transcription factor [Anaerolineae bacterium]|jgi:DNA-binding response OmpR family regulator